MHRNVPKIINHETSYFEASHSLNERGMEFNFLYSQPFSPIIPIIHFSYRTFCPLFRILIFLTEYSADYFDYYLTLCVPRLGLCPSIRKNRSPTPGSPSASCRPRIPIFPPVRLNKGNRSYIEIKWKDLSFQRVLL